MKMKVIYFCFFLFIGFACTSNKEQISEKFQKHRDNIINYKNNIKDVKSEIIVGNSPDFEIIDSLLFFEDGTANEKCVQIYSNISFKHLINTGIIGRGPGEITRSGEIAINYKTKTLWVQDYGKMVMWKFPIDSVLKNENFKPTQKLNLNKELFISRFDFLNDSIALGKALYLGSNHSVCMSMAYLNIKNNKIIKYGYEHPETVGKKSKSYFRLSAENNLYINCYTDCDLMTICNLDGTLKYNIYGPGWKTGNKKFAYFKGVRIMGNSIISSYIGDKFIYFDEFKRPQAKLPTKLLVFDLEGNYIKTIDVGYEFTSFCVDNKNNRVFFYFKNREHPLGYISLNL